MDKKPHILFVDDESNILMGLRRGLHGKRKLWKMSFAEGGHEALELVRNDHIDVIVTDMRMPIMDGAQLLEEVRELSPDTARVVLSGYSKDEAILRVVGAAHQYLAKPCNFELLEATLERLITFRANLDKYEVREKITQMKSLPSLPDVYQELMVELQNDFSTNKSIAAVMEKDLGMKAQVLKICNSAFFGLPQQVNDLPSAISLLGMDTLRSMSLLSGVFSSYKGSAQELAVMQKICDDSLEISLVAQKLSKLLYNKSELGELVSCAGTLSHVGSLVIAISWPQEFKQVMQLSQKQDKPIEKIEQGLIGVDHAWIGAYFLGLWGFSFNVCEAVAYQHQPGNCPDVPQPVLTVVYLAHELIRFSKEDNSNFEMFLDTLDQEFLNKQHIDIADVDWAGVLKVKAA
ncbi:putative HDOD domain family [Candidatus Terasakiella magnetica]|uniref:Putative HDOD domain family n=1 Tax=Candidatus Terasakiella magnetica TaxID=1867952 RepID=A0A1C3RJ26_9PROT|nr:HDOD domain-containing protein [Candidatus Terasakiella magnetica]SCA57261.1 putative HDOD domain family [Candidatus Terasakiella magnetica]